jgi:phospholipid transport system transporter-binding protein
MRAPDQIMKTRKPKPAASKRATRRPAGSGASPRRSSAARGKAVPAPAAESGGRADGPLALGADCTVVQADALKSELARRVTQPRPVALDVSALQRIDTAGLQLLAAFVRDRRTAGLAIEWHGRSPPLEAAAGLLGLNDMLELAGEVGR